MNANVNACMLAMVDFSEGNLHDIAHFTKVHGYAETIACAEGLDDATRETVEVAALVHDIACPLCREKYGNTMGKYQELEGGPLARELLEGLGFSAQLVDRVSWLVAHHHTYDDVEGIDYRILLEADFLVNAHESELGRDAISAFRDRVFRTGTGLRLLDSMYLRD